ncbi:MAG TPA: hypothetical protein VNM14_10510 [Planctomycetota bacterium]|nr:hypothetical protein [Planctomycetota bacterium]
MRAWTSPEGIVVDLGPTREPVVAILQGALPDGPWRDLHEFLVLETNGTPRKRCIVRTWSLDDELGATAYSIVGGELRELRVSLWTTERPRVDRREELVAGNLQELPPGPDPAWEVVRRAVAIL